LKTIPNFLEMDVNLNFSFFKQQDYTIEVTANKDMFNNNVQTLFLKWNKDKI
jgi:hypothetical protein